MKNTLNMYLIKRGIDGMSNEFIRMFFDNDVKKIEWYMSMYQVKEKTLRTLCSYFGAKYNNEMTTIENKLFLVKNNDLNEDMVRFLVSGDAYISLSLLFRTYVKGLYDRYESK